MMYDARKESNKVQNFITVVLPLRMRIEYH